VTEIRNRITCEDVKENPITLRIEATPGKMLRKNIQKVPAKQAKQAKQDTSQFPKEGH
jgi:hypothetical protein